MSYGSLSSTTQKILSQIVKRWNVDDVYIGYSVDFAVERFLKHVIGARLHSNGVTIYSCLLGRYFSGKPLNVKMKDSYTGVMRFVDKYFDDGVGTVAVMLILSKMSIYLGSRTNAYYERMTNAYINQFEQLWNKTKEKLEKIPPFISSIYESDVCKLVDKIPKNVGFIFYLPFFTDDYEKEFRVIDEMFDWNPPEFESMNKDRIKEIFAKLVQREYFILCTNDYLVEFKHYLVGISQTTNRGVPLYIYAKSNKSVVVLPHQKTESLLIPRLGESEDIGNEIKLMKLNTPEFNSLRSLYMNTHISPAIFAVALGVLVDGKIIGSYAFDRGPMDSFAKFIDTPYVYLLSDFAVSPVKYKHLAKLVLYASLSRESRDIAERVFTKKIYSLTTTAFSTNPVSMKYRGLFRLLVRTQLNENEYRLIYGTDLGRWSLSEALKIWKDKYGKEVV